MRRWARSPWQSLGAAVVAVTVTGGCTAGEITTACPAVAPFRGVVVEVAAPLANRAVSVSVRVCQDGLCDDRDANLRSRGQDAAETCADLRNCGPAPSGSRAEVSLPWGRGPAQVSLVLRDGTGTTIGSPSVELTPVESYPLGPRCGATFQASVEVGGDGVARPGATPAAAG